MWGPQRSPGVSTRDVSNRFIDLTSIPGRIVEAARKSADIERATQPTPPGFGRGVQVTLSLVSKSNRPDLWAERCQVETSSVGTKIKSPTN